MSYWLHRVTGKYDDALENTRKYDFDFDLWKNEHHSVAAFSSAFPTVDNCSEPREKHENLEYRNVQAENHLTQRWTAVSC